MSEIIDRDSIIVQEVQEALIAGKNGSDIIQIIENKYELARRQALSYIDQARIAMKNELANNLAFSMAEHVTARRNLRRILFDNQDYKLYFEVLKDEAKLLRLYESVGRENWKQQVVILVNNGSYSINQVIDEFGETLAIELFGEERVLNE